MSFTVLELGRDSEARFVGCGVCEKSWQEAIGEKPTRFFGR
jgi:hypothetical protein